MRRICFLILLVFATAGRAQECTTDSEIYEGKTVTFETCTAAVDEAVKGNFEGYRSAAYVVKWKGQRVVVFDISSESDFVAGDPISFVVIRIPPPWESAEAAASRKYLQFFLTDSKPVKASGQK